MASLYMISQFAWRPFNNGMLDIVDCFAMITITFYISCGLAFLDGNLSKTSDVLGYRITFDLLGAACLVISVFTICFSLLVFCVDIYAQKNIKDITQNIKCMQATLACVESTEERSADGGRRLPRHKGGIISFASVHQSITEDDELPGTIEPQPLLRCFQAQSRAGADAMRRFLDAYRPVSDAASRWLGDTGVMSAYANNPQVLLMRSLRPMLLKE